jgi:hypothetical protein
MKRFSKPLGRPAPEFHPDGTVAEYVDYRHYEELERKLDSLVNTRVVIKEGTLKKNLNDPPTTPRPPPPRAQVAHESFDAPVPARQSNICTCKFSAAWRCAVAMNSPHVACACICHRRGST